VFLLGISALRSKVVISFFLIILVFLVGYIIVGSQYNEQKTDLLAKLTSKIRLIDIQLHFGQNGREKWRLDALKVDDWGKEQLLDQVKFKYLTQDNQTINIISPKATIKNNSDQIFLYPKVKILSNNLRSGCNELVFDRTKNTLWLKGGFFLHDKLIQIKAQQAQLDLEKNIFSAQGQVRCVIYYKGENKNENYY